MLKMCTLGTTRTLLRKLELCRSGMSDSLCPYGLQHTRPPCPSPSPGACSNSCPWVSDTLNYFILCHPLFLPPPILPSIRVFSNEPTLCIMCPKYWSFSFSISPSREYSRLMVLQPTPVFLPGKSYGQRSLEGYSPKSWTPLSNFTFHFEDTFTGRTEENTLKQWPWSPLRERILPCAFPCFPQRPS